MSVEFKMLLAAEIPGLMVRELAEIRCVKTPIWRDTHL